MANWTILKEAIASVIKTNGNQEITGAVLQSTLNSIVNSIGENATFAGIATPTTNPGTPDGPVFYLATQAGTYANFNGIEIAEGEAVILQWNNGTWSKKVTDFATSKKLTELESNTNAKISEICSSYYNLYFVGANRTYVSTNIYGLITGNQYRVTLKTTEWDKPADFGSNPAGFNIQYTKGGVSYSLYTSLLSSTPNKAIAFTVPESDYITIGGRAASGVKVWYNIEDITKESVSVSLINTANFIPNIDTKLLTLDLGSDPILCVGSKSYTLKTIFSDEQSAYRRISLSDGSTSGAMRLVFNLDSARLYVKKFDAKMADSEVLIGGIRLTYISSAGMHTFRSANFPFAFRIDGKREWEDNDSDSIEALNGGTNELLRKLKDLYKRKGIYGNANYGNKICNIIFTSDAHNSTTYLSRIVAFKNSMSDYIDDILHGGDSVSDQFVNDNPFANIEGGEYILNTIGNHDNWDSSNTTGEAVGGRVPQKLVYDKFISPYISYWSSDKNPVVQPNEASAQGYCYYYKDYTESKLRLIVLNCMNYDGAQNDWLSGVLDNAITQNYHVIICNHYTPNSAFTLDRKCTFSSIYDNGDNVGSSSLPALASATVEEKIESGLNFICWLFGHYHRDFFGYLTNYPSQYGLAVDKTSPGGGWERDCYRSGDGRERDAFDIISVDTTHGTMTVLRIGNNRDKFMRQKNYLVFDYVNKEILFNS